jgi:hypothetical protein
MSKRDIVSRLRSSVPYGLDDATLLRDAAAEIERLRALLAEENRETNE